MLPSENTPTGMALAVKCLLQIHCLCCECFSACGDAMELSGRFTTVIGIGILVAASIVYYASAEIIDIRIEDKVAGFDVPSSDGRAPQVLFLVYTDRGVFNVGMEPLYLEFRAAERYHARKVGERYRALVAGWRILWTNWYPRLIRVVD